MNSTSNVSLIKLSKENTEKLDGYFNESLGYGQLMECDGDYRIGVASDGSGYVSYAPVDSALKEDIKAFLDEREDALTVLREEVRNHLQDLKISDEISAKDMTDYLDDFDRWAENEAVDGKSYSVKGEDFTFNEPQFEQEQEHDEIPQ